VKVARDRQIFYHFVVEGGPKENIGSIIQSLGTSLVFFAAVLTFSIIPSASTSGEFPVWL